MASVDLDLKPLGDVLVASDARLNDPDARTRVWPTGFGGLDASLNGGLRSGNLVLLAGAQGLGKTTWALQMARNVARGGYPVIYFCYEHDQESLLARLIALETGELGGREAGTLDQIRLVFDGDKDNAVTGESDTLEEQGDRGLGERLAHVPYAAEGLDRVLEYAPYLHLHRSTGAYTTLDVITKAVEQIWRAGDTPPVVFIDYLQKVPVPEAGSEDDRITTVVERLKDLALDAEIPIVAIAASDKGGLESGKRMRAQHLRGSTALAYEADVLLVLAEKYDIVARHHLVFSTQGANTFRDWAVLTIEKNRNGRDNIDIQFRKRFEQSRYEGDGERVAEHLIDERVFVE
jgi:replicative DNA helicase